MTKKRQNKSKSSGSRAKKPSSESKSSLSQQIPQSYASLQGSYPYSQTHFDAQSYASAPRASSKKPRRSKDIEAQEDEDDGPNQWRAKILLVAFLFCLSGTSLVYASMGLPITSININFGFSLWHRRAAVLSLTEPQFDAIPSNHLYPRKKDDDDDDDEEDEGTTFSLRPHTQINCDSVPIDNKLAKKAVCGIFDLILTFNPLTGTLYLIHVIIVFLGSLELFHLLLRMLFARQNSGACACFACCMKCAICICTMPCKPCILLFFTIVGMALCALSALAAWLDHGIADLLGNDKHNVVVATVTTQKGSAAYFVPAAACCFFLAVFLDVTEIIADYAACLCSCMPCLIKKAVGKKGKRRGDRAHNSGSLLPVTQQPQPQPMMAMPMGMPFMIPASMPLMPPPAPRSEATKSTRSVNSSRPSKKSMRSKKSTRGK